jgi:hypothetical protein
MWRTVQRRLASIERMLLRGFGILLRDDLGERSLDILLTCPQELLQSRDELVMDPLRLSARLISLRACDAEALRGRMLAVSLERVGPCKKVPAEVAEVDRQRVVLRRVAVPLVVVPRFEHHVGTASELDLTNRATFPVGFRGSEERLPPHFEPFQELKVLDHFLLLLFLLLLLLRFLLHATLDPKLLSVHSLSHPCWKLGPCKGRW